LTPEFAPKRCSDTGIRTRDLIRQADEQIAAGKKEMAKAAELLAHADILLDASRGELAISAKMLDLRPSPR